MDGLIFRKALIEECKKKRIVVHTTDDPFEVIREQGRVFRKVVDEAPTVDAVEVVRCKDCDNTCPGNSGLVCTIWGAGTAPDAFCSYGERKAK